MKTIFSWLALICAGLIVVGCGQKESGETTPSDTPDITMMPKKWREAHTNGPIFGFTLDKREGRIVGKFCRLEPGEGFKIKSSSPEGEYMPSKKALVLLYHEVPVIGSMQEMMAAGMPHVVIPLDPKATELKGQLVSPSEKQTYTFVPAK